MRSVFSVLFCFCLICSLVLPASAEEIIEVLPDQLDVDAYLQISGSDSQPSGSDSLPSGSDSLPSGSDSQPSGSDSLPSGSDSQPSGSDSLPSGSDSQPSGSDLLFSSFPEFQDDAFSDSLPNFTISPLSVTASETNGLKSIVLELIGDYEPVVTIESYRRDNQSALTYITDISYDWPWLASAFVFSLVLYCVLKMIGGFLCNL